MRMTRSSGARCALMLCLAAWTVPALAGPEEDGNAGLDAMKAGKFAQAVQLFTRALASPKLASDDREFAYVQRGTAYLNLDNKRAALADFEKALKIKPDDADAKEGLASARAPGGGGAGGKTEGNASQIAQQGMTALKDADYPQAIALFGRAIATGRLSGDDLELAYLSRGQANLKQGNIQAAVQDLDEALHRKPDDSDAQQAFGEALGKVPAAAAPPPFDAAACKKAITSEGAATQGGKTFNGFADYPGVDRLTAFAGLYRAITKFSPSFGTPWQITTVNFRNGVIVGTVTPPGSTFEVQLDARIGGASVPRVTMQEKMTGPLLMIDIRGSMCKTLAAVAH